MSVTPSHSDGKNTVILSHKIKLNPTPEQVTYFKKACGTVRFAYNWGLAEWQRRYEAGEKASANSLKKAFNSIKREEYPWVYEVTGRATEYGFTRLGVAFKNFFDGLKNGNRRGYPKFKSKRDAHQSFYVANTELRLDGHWLKIPRLDSQINMAEPLRFDGKVMSGVISTDGLDWYISIAVEMECGQEPQPGRVVGIDLGVKDMAVTSDGDVYENGHFHKSELRKLRRLNRELARREKGSNGWLRTKAKLQKLHRAIRNRRMDATHKMTTELAKEHSVIAVEDLNVKGMVKNRSLARAISDVGMGEIVRQLEYKAELYGAFVVKVDRWFPSSRLCHDCGSKNEGLTLSDRTWICEDCGVVHERDLNAAKNLRDEGLRLLAERSVLVWSSDNGPGARVRPAVLGGVR